MLFPKELLLIDDLSNFEKILLTFLIDLEYNRYQSQIDINYLTGRLNKPFKKLQKSFQSLERKDYLSYSLTSERTEIHPYRLTVDFSVNLEKIYK